jgi:beta-1,2-mannobiose phosphorylase / 1,2-beta-oligomannan phosphorylase
MSNKKNRPPQVQRLGNGLPLIRPVASHPWENKVTFNPACTLVENRSELDSIIATLPFTDEAKRTLSVQPALCFLLYRAQGRKTETYDHTRSTIGLAVLSPDLQLLARHNQPVILPDKEYDNLGVEDGRITKVGDRYIMMYCAYSAGQTKNNIRIAMASTRDFLHWEKHGLLRGNFNIIDNKNAMLFPAQVNGKHLLLHRPMEGKDAMSIHWAEADDVFGEWRSRGLLMNAIPNPAFVDTWIGGGAPPLMLPDGRYLIVYHVGNRKAEGTREYDLGIAIGDFSRSEFIVKRSEPLLQPGSYAETTGDVELGVNNVVFICGAYFFQNDLFFPYAGADSVVLAGKISKKQIDRYLD